MEENNVRIPEDSWVDSGDLAEVLLVWEKCVAQVRVFPSGKIVNALIPEAGKDSVMVGDTYSINTKYDVLLIGDYTGR